MLTAHLAQRLSALTLTVSLSLLPAVALAGPEPESEQAKISCYVLAAETLAKAGESRIYPIEIRYSGAYPTMSDHGVDFAIILSKNGLGSAFYYGKIATNFLQPNQTTYEFDCGVSGNTPVTEMFSIRRKV